LLEDAQAHAVEAANAADGRNLIHLFNRTKALFDGHEAHPSVYKRNADGWIWELASPIPSEIYHLNPKGYAMLAHGVFDAYFANYSLVPVAAAPVPTPSDSVWRDFFHHLFRFFFG
jgi:hypothetical protein